MGAIRLFLALVVAFDHFRVIVLRPVKSDVWTGYTLGMNAGYAVMFFHVISGFLMSMVLSEKYDATLQGTAAFYRARIIRIFSLFWPLVFLLFAASPDYRALFFEHSIADKATNFGLLGMSWRIVFASYPDFHWDAALFPLRQTWTLDAELSFYLLAPLLLRSWKLALPVTVVCVAIRGYAVQRYGFSDRWTYMFMPATFVFFLLGHWSYRIAQSLNILGGRRLGLTLLAISMIAMGRLWSAEALWDSPRFWISVSCFALSLPGVFDATRGSKVSNWLGDLSFPTYLIHVAIIVKLSGFDFFQTPNWSSDVLMGWYIAAIVLAAIVLRYVVELPAAAVARAILTPRTRIGKTNLVRPPI